MLFSPGSYNTQVICGLDVFSIQSLYLSLVVAPAFCHIRYCRARIVKLFSFSVRDNPIFN
jgi:hypothetical protein